MRARQLAALSALVAAVAIIVAIVFFASGHPLRGIVLLVAGLLVAAFAGVTSRR